MAEPASTRPLALMPAKRIGRGNEIACAEPDSMPIIRNSRSTHCGYSTLAISVGRSMVRPFVA